MATSLAVSEVINRAFLVRRTTHHAFVVAPDSPRESCLKRQENYSFIFDRYLTAIPFRVDRKQVVLLDRKGWVYVGGNNVKANFTVIALFDFL